MNIVEIFDSTQGEGLWSGTPMTFVRFGGCNLNCSFCDTQKSGKELGREEVLSNILQSRIPRVCITGGEPTIQKDDLNWLVHALKFQGKKVHIETNGTVAIHYPDVFITVSPKPGAEVKIWWNVISEYKILVDENGPLTTIPKSKDDYASISYSTPIFLQPVDPAGELYEECKGALAYLQRVTKALETIQKIQTERPELRLSLQLHKILGIR